MPEDLRFIDPAFTCEVVLTGTARALYDAAKPQFERLEGIRCLGMMAQIQKVAQHTRHQHLVGLMRIFNKLCQQPPKKGLPKSFLWSFWCRLCFAQTGHAALSYDSEKAVLLACQLDTTFRDKLRVLLQPVTASVTECQGCTRSGCEEAAKGAAEGVVWFDELVNKNRWYHVHRWVGALKLLKHPKLMAILNGQILNGGNNIGFSQSVALRLMVAPECKWGSAVRNISRLDFIPRDLAFAGTINIRLDVDSLVSAANEPHPDWALLTKLSGYMSENIYETSEQQLASALFQRALAALLIKDKLSLEELFGIDPADALSDDELKTVVAKTSAGKQVFDENIRKYWRVWPISTYVDGNRLPSEVEKVITGYTKGHLNQHVATKVTCVKLLQQNSLALAFMHRDQSDRPDAKAFVKLCRRVLLKQLPRINTEELANALYEGLVDRKCKHKLDAAISRLSKLGLTASLLKPAANVINERATIGGAGDGAASIQLGGFTYALHGDPLEFRIHIMHAVISAAEAARKNLGISLEDAATVLWNELLRWQSFHFGLKSTKTFSTLLEHAQNALAQQVVANAPNAAQSLEDYALLEALKHPLDSVSFRVALPNLELIQADGRSENEYDVVSVSLKEDKLVEVWVWGVTIEQDLAPKQAADMEKIQKLKNLLGQRWDGDVTVRTCYIHRGKNAICCEIDGTQTTRPVPAAVAAA